MCRHKTMADQPTNISTTPPKRPIQLRAIPEHRAIASRLKATLKEMAHKEVMEGMEMAVEDIPTVIEKATTPTMTKWVFVAERGRHHLAPHRIRPVVLSSLKDCRLRWHRKTLAPPSPLCSLALETQLSAGVQYSYTIGTLAKLALCPYRL